MNTIALDHQIIRALGELNFSQKASLVSQIQGFAEASQDQFEKRKNKALKQIRKSFSNETNIDW